MRRVLTVVRGRPSACTVSSGYSLPSDTKSEAVIASGRTHIHQKQQHRSLTNPICLGCIRQEARESEVRWTHDQNSVHCENATDKKLWPAIDELQIVLLRTVPGKSLSSTTYDSLIRGCQRTNNTYCSQLNKHCCSRSRDHGT